jgi:hypothetical protein
MGNDFNFEITAFLKCTTHLTESTKKVKTCTNTDCVKHGKELFSTFCSDCGGSIAAVDLPAVLPKVNQWKLADEIEMRLWCRSEAIKEGDNEIHIWLPNLRPTFKTFEADENKAKPFEIFDFSIEEEKAKFENQFKEDIEFLKEKYDACSVEYGIVTYWS